MALFDANIISYFLNPAEHFIKRIIVFLCIVFGALLIDGYVGFSDFYFAKSKAETLEKISNVLKDSTICQADRSLLQSEYHMVAQKESYKVVFFRFIHSIRDNKYALTTTISTHPLHAPNNKPYVPLKINKSIPTWLSIILYILSSGIVYWSVIIFLTYKYITSKTVRDTAKNGILYKWLLIFLALATCSPFVFLFIPPYEFNTLDRYVTNFVYHLVSLFVLLLLFGLSLNGKKNNPSFPPSK